ncbi:MAG: DNA polymerase, partial [Eubacteriales bacterium]
ASSSLLDLSAQYRIACPSTPELLAEYKVKSMLDIPEIVVARHCMLHSMATLKLYHIFYPQMNHTYYNAELATFPIMLEMSERGILLDQDERERIEYCLEEDLTKAEQSCAEIAAFNPGSPQQVSYVLAERGAYKVFTRLPFTRDKFGRKTTKLSSDVKVLEAMDDPLAGLILSYRQKKKLQGTYIKPWAGEERARCRYHLEAATGRPSSTDRNMQNIPGKFSKTGVENDYNCRGMLLPDSGVWADIDFSQVEPRALAYLSGDREMRWIFSQPKFLPDGAKNPDADIHGQVATFMDVTRKLGKVINLAMTYGATDETLMETARIRDKHRAAELRTMWGRKFPQAMDWINSTQQQALRTRIVHSAFGRAMRIPDEEGDARVKRCAVDYPCQSTAADILKRGLVVLSDKGMDLALQVHDEFLVDGYHQEVDFECLRNIGPFETPFEVKYCERWE